MRKPILRFLIVSGALVILSLYETRAGEISVTPPEIQLIDPAVTFSSTRKWTSVDGRVVEAKLESCDESNVTLKLKNNQTALVPLSKLVETDREFTGRWKTISRYFDLSNKKPSPKSSLDFLFLNSHPGIGTTHETSHFQIKTDTPLNREDLIELASLLEYCHAALVELPLRLKVSGPIGGKFSVEYYSSPKNYKAAGGKSNTNSTYLAGRNTLIFTGIDNESTKNSLVNRRNIIFETTQALMSQWSYISQAWFVVGVAEYLACADRCKKNEDITVAILARHNEIFGIGQVVGMYTVITYTPIGAEQLIVEGMKPFYTESEEKDETISLNPVAEAEIKVRGEGGILEKGDIVPIRPTVIRKSVMRPNRKDCLTLNSLYYIHYLLKKEPEALRKFLAFLVVKLSERDQYLKIHEKELREHQAKVADQQASFDKLQDKYFAEVKKYNSLVESALEKKYTNSNISPIMTHVINENEPRPNPNVIPGLDKPLSPSIPKRIPVPEILKNPRKSSELSNKHIMRKAAQTILPLPKTLERLTL